jgi:L-ascorbate metabolism protein UlaG (beta-lactamase superfamily)
MLKLTWYGNASVRIDTPETGIVIDPYKTRNPKLQKLELKDISDVSAILLTHGHFDHAADVPNLSGLLKANIHLPREIADNLKRKQNMSGEKFIIPEFGEAFQIGPMKIRMLRGRHIRFDKPLVIKTLLRSLLSPVKLFRIAKAPFPEGRTVAWLIEYGNIRLLHLGSLGLDPHEDYPEGVNLLSIPLQGHSRIHEMAFKIIERLKPGRVFLHHFDDAFPPVSQRINPGPLVEMLGRNSPEMSVIVPEFGASVAIDTQS